MQRLTFLCCQSRNRKHEDHKRNHIDIDFTDNSVMQKGDIE